MVRFQLGIVSCLLAGCVSQPTAPGPRLDLAAAPVQKAPAGLTLRIGVEYLPPEAGQEVEAPIADVSYTFEPVEDQHPARSQDPRKDQERRNQLEAQHPWAMSISDLDAIDNPIAREALHFVDDLLREDQRRVKHEVRLPFFDYQPTDIEGGPKLWSEEETTQAQAEWIREHGPGLLQQPLRRMLRRLPIARDVEVEIHDFRSDNVPFSEPYLQAHGDERSFGRMSFRLHASNLKDPVEIAYMRSGIRVSTSQSKGKVSIDWQLTDRWELELRGSNDYDTHANHARAELVFWPSRTTSVHLSVGDDLDFLSTSSIYSLFESPMDGRAGLLLYAVSTF